MTDEQLTIVQDAMQHPLLASEGDIQVEVISKDLSPEQASLVIGIKMDSAKIHLLGIARALKFKALRATFPVGQCGKPNQEARMGWADFLRREFDTNVRDVNYEIAAIEAGENVLLQSEQGGAPPHVILKKMGSSHLNEIGRGSTPAIRRKIWDKLLEGKLSLTGKAIRAEVKSLNSDARKLKLRAPAPPKAPSPPRLPTPDKPTAGGKPMSISKWTAEGTPQGARMDQELNYLGGEETGNASFAEGLKKLRKNSSRSGKLARIQALALALHTECKSVSDRYQLESEKSGRDWKRYMTVWQHHWADTDQLDMAQALKQIASEMAEASRHLEITGMLSWSDDVQLEI